MLFVSNSGNKIHS